MSEQTKEDRAADQARAQFESIRELVAALECDYDRLEELKDERADLVEAVEEAKAYEEDDPSPTRANKAIAALEEWDAENGEELKELTEAAGDCEDQDEARQRIEEDALSVEVRSDWTTPGEKMEAGEYCILLCTGGPAARIVGDLNGGEPCSARLEYQDWGVPWTEYVNCDRDTLLTYARCFYFGE